MRWNRFGWVCRKDETVTPDSLKVPSKTATSHTEQLQVFSWGGVCSPSSRTSLDFTQGEYSRRHLHCCDWGPSQTLCTSFDVSKTMQYLKKYFTEGLIQMAILLSLCGVRVDVGLEPYLSPSWHEMILGPTSALTQTQFHNLRNRLEDGQSPHPKNVDLDGFFTARRLLGWVHSLDRLQVGKHLFIYFSILSCSI